MANSKAVGVAYSDPILDGAVIGNSAITGGTITGTTVTNVSVGGTASFAAISGSTSSLGITGLAAAQGGAVAVRGGTSSTSANAGGAVTLLGGTAGLTGAGGGVTITAGSGGVTSGAGGNIGVVAGSAAGTNSAGGSVTLLAGTATGSGTIGVIASRGVVTGTQGAPAAKTVSGVLTAADILTGIITVAQGAGAASAQQLPLATALDTALPGAIAGDSFDFSVINTSVTAAESATVTTNTGWTLVGAMDVPAYSAAGSLNSSARLRARKTGTGTWVLYRIS